MIFLQALTRSYAQKITTKTKNPTTTPRYSGFYIPGIGQYPEKKAKSGPQNDADHKLLGDDLEKMLNIHPARGQPAG